MQLFKNYYLVGRIPLKYIVRIWGNRGDGIRLICHGWLKLGLVTNLIFVVICLLVLASLRASLDDSMLKQQQGWLRSFSTSWFLTVDKGMG